MPTNSLTERGFTDHEHLEGVELIHMNGRIYDYNLGRFLSVDPFVVAPTDSQSWNPYTYIRNNPLSGTDPTGYAECPDGICASDIKVDDVETLTINNETGAVTAQLTNGKTVSVGSISGTTKVTSTGSRISKSVNATISFGGGGGANAGGADISSGVKTEDSGGDVESKSQGETRKRANADDKKTFVEKNKRKFKKLKKKALRKLRKTVKTLSEDKLTDRQLKQIRNKFEIEEVTPEIINILINRSLDTIDSLENGGFLSPTKENLDSLLNDTGVQGDEEDDSGFGFVARSDQKRRIFFQRVFFIENSYIGQLQRVIHEGSHFDGNRIGGTIDITAYYPREGLLYNDSYRFSEFVTEFN